MNKTLLNKLIVNALYAYNDRLACDGCNDLFADDPLLKGVSKAEREQIRKAWVKAFPKSAKECNNKLDFNGQLVDVLIHSVKELS